MIKNMIRRLMLFVSLIVFLTSSVGSTYGFVVTKTDSIVNIFTPFETVINNLIITKTVEHPYGDDYLIPDSVSFDFRIDLGASYANTVLATSSGEITADADGSAVVSVKPSKPLSVYGLDKDVKVTVTELNGEGGGFTAKDRITVREGVIPADGNLKLDFVNVYSPAAVSPDISVVGQKILSGREWQDGDLFNFVLEMDVDGEWITLGSRSTAYDGSDPDFDRFDFTDVISSLSFDKVGHYSFRITELNEGLMGIGYDESVNSFDIIVTDADMDGSLEISSIKGSGNTKVTESDGSYEVSVVFNNTFTPVTVDPNAAELAVTVNKTVKNTGSGSIGPAGFEFVLENTASGEKLTLNTNSDGKAVFKLGFTAEDIGKTLRYKLYETDKGSKGVTYDKKVYDIGITVSSDGGGNPVISVKVDGIAAESVVCGFENVYSGTALSPGSNSGAPGGAPQTGDAKLGVWMALMAVSASVCIILVLTDRRSRSRAR